jgi:hypothetical protein
MQMGRGGRCLGTAEKVRLPRVAPTPVRDLAKRAPVTAPVLRPLAPLDQVVLGGSVPRWYASADDVRRLAQVPARERFVRQTAWHLGAVYTLMTTPQIGEVPAQVDYYFMGDNLVGYGVRFFVEQPAAQTLYDTVVGEARKSYGKPAKESLGSLDWQLPELAVHLALTDSPAMTQLHKRPVKLAQMQWTVPPQSLADGKTH